MYTRLATHFVDRNQMKSLRDALFDSQSTISIHQILNQFSSSPSEPSFLQNHRAEIDHCFSAMSLPEIFDRLRSHSNQSWATKTLKTLGQMSPTSLLLTFEAIKKGGSWSLAETFSTEYRIAYRLSMKYNQDFREGVRALIVDKDQSPRWQSIDWKTSTIANELMRPFDSDERGDEIDFQVKIDQWRQQNVSH